MTPRQKMRRFLFRTVSSCGCGVKPGSPEFSAGMVLAAATLVGTNADALADATGFSAEFTARVVSRLRKAGVIRGARIRQEWDHGEYGNFAFLLDAVVGAGVGIGRCGDPKKTEARKARAETRVAAGRCVACGRPRETTEKRTCAVCRASVRASQQRRQVPVGPFTPALTHADGWYFADDVVKDR